MNEDELIALLRPLAGQGALDLEDDAALLSLPQGQDLVISTDTMVEGVHFPEGRIGGGFSERLLRTALSDLAAKAARPVGYTLNIAWPQGRNPIWIKGFVQGLHDAQSAFDCPLLGGDTTSTSGPLVTSATVYGRVPSGKAVLRSGAVAGDDVWHTGRLGLAEAGLAIVRGEPGSLPPEQAHFAEEAYLRPVPRFVFRKVLREYATAAADISDGLLRDASHIARASGVALDLFPDIVETAGAFGDDYEILFTASPQQRESIVAEAGKLGLPVTRCGTVVDGEGVFVGGNPAHPAGYNHTLT
ncbi:MAG: thiamine-phosphate kinase [Litorimonas sp.]